MAKIINRKSIKTKILGIVLLSVFLVTAALGYLSFTFSKERLIAMLGESIEGVAATTSRFIKPEDITLIATNAAKIREKYVAASSATLSRLYDKMSEETPASDDPALREARRAYVKYAQLLSDIKAINKIESPINVYVVDNDTLTLVLTTDKVLLSGAKYIMRPEVEEVLASGMPRSTGVYRDKDGSWISAYAPVISATSGTAKAIVEINHRIDSYVERLHQELGIIILVCLIGFICAAIISYHLVNNLVSSIQQLDRIAEELELERYDVPIEVKSDDEIGHLADTFEKLRVSMREKIEELRLSLVREKRAHLESLVALTNAMELRDPYTRQHLHRVERYALLIAKAMHLSREEIIKLKYSCFLHDIGKIYIEASLLQKVKLAPGDFDEIKKHSERGAKIIEGIQFLTDVKEAVLHHQEHYDGTGYPKGLKGKEIPPLARIVAVADAFDAMTTNRPYRQKMNFKEALDEIERNAGIQFDPDVCNALLKYRNTIEDIARRHFKQNGEMP